MYLHERRYVDEIALMFDTFAKNRSFMCMHMYVMMSSSRHCKRDVPRHFRHRQRAVAELTDLYYQDLHAAIGFCFLYRRLTSGSLPCSTSRTGQFSTALHQMRLNHPP